MGCTYERKRLAGTDCVGCTCDRKQFRRIIVFFSSTIRISVFERSPVAHDLILPNVCARRAYPRRFLGRVGRTPYRPHSLGDGSKCRRGKGLKTVCLGPTRTSATTTREPMMGRPHSLRCPGSQSSSISPTMRSSLSY